MTETKIDREAVKKTFAEYVAGYNHEDGKIKLKVDHTYRVADLCDQIARKLGLSDTQIDFAWLSGMLHDIGRFEQVRRFGTFIDAQSIDHAQFGADLLFHDGLIREYLAESVNDTLLETSIRNHNRHRVEEHLEGETEMFCHILRDADKLDILKVCVESSFETVYEISSYDLYESEITPAVMDSFLRHETVLHSLKKTPVDRVVGIISLTFELVYPESIHIVSEQGYLDQLLSFQSRLPSTQENFKKLRQEMESFLLHWNH